MRQLNRWKLAGLATFAGVLAAGIALAELVPGGGNPSTDCYVELDVHGATGSNRICCTDGDPNCDTDGQVNDTCTFSIAVCVNQINIPQCTPKALPRPPLVPRQLRSHLPVIQGTAPACGLPTDFPVHLMRRHGGKLPGRARLGTRAGGRDKDHLFLTCRPSTSPCPSQTTSTTTSSTTTTTRP